MSAMPSLIELANTPGAPEAAVLLPLRQQAQAALTAGLDWPGPKVAAFRHTRLTALGQHPWQLADTTAAALPSDLADRLPALRAGHHRLVLIDGVPAWPLCQLPLAEKGTYVADLAEGLAARPQLLAHLDALGLHQQSALSALNASRAHHGALVHIKAQATSSAPLELLFVHTGDVSHTLVQPRVLVALDPQAQGVILETHLGLTDGATWSNAATDLVLEANASLYYAVVQAEGIGAHHLATLTAQVHQDARLNLCVVDEGSKLTHRNLQVNLIAPGAEAHVASIALGKREQHLDTQAVVRHMAPHANSNQSFRTVLDGHSTGVFCGMVHVLPDAQKIAAKQMSRGLILSPGAQAIIKPQLMILADDVKCAHGATVGQIDEDAYFYLTSRGIDAVTARRMLTFAFLADALSQAPDGLRDMLMARTCAWLGLPEAIATPMTA